MSRFDQVLRFVLNFEGGYANDPNDKGGETNLGITEGTMARAYKNGLVDSADVKTLTRYDAARIYEAFYWKPLYCHVLPQPMDIIVFDIAVNCGTGGAGKIIQETLNEFMGCGLRVDGVVGPKTWKAMTDFLTADREYEDARLKERPLLRGFCLGLLVNRMELYDDITDESNKAQEVRNRKFLRGWLARAIKLGEIAGLDK